MTSKKKLKRAIRARAAESGTSYSTMRRAMGVAPPGSTEPLEPVLPGDGDRPPVEEIPTGLHPDFLNEFVTLHIIGKGEDIGGWRMGSVAAPLFAVSFAVVGGKREGCIELEVGKSRAIVFARKTPADASCWAAFHRAKQQYPSLEWQETSGVGNFAVPGASTPYWVQWLTEMEDGSIVWERGSRGLKSLDDVLSGKCTPEDDPAGPPPA